MYKYEDLSNVYYGDVFALVETCKTILFLSLEQLLFVILKAI